MSFKIKHKQHYIFEQTISPLLNYLTSSALCYDISKLQLFLNTGIL